MSDPKAEAMVYLEDKKVLKLFEVPNMTFFFPMI